jgi:hypothetical protein
MSEESPSYYHDRASKSSYEARGRAMSLSAAGIAGLFALITGEGFMASGFQKNLIVFSGCFLAISIGFGVFNSYADAQWSYYRAVLVDLTRTDGSKELERKWHKLKSISELMTQIGFVIGVLLAALLLVLKVYELKSP